MWTGVIFGTLGTLTCESWPVIWIILEINIMAFIRLFSSKWSAKKRCIVYFIVQRVGSLIILRRGVLSDWSKMATWTILGITLKARIAPLHFWGGVVITRLTSSTAFIFLTWQKIAPVFLLFVTRPKMLALIQLVMLVIMIPVCFIVYPIFPTPVEKLTPSGLLVNYSALISFLASILFPTAIYSTNEDARTYLKGLIYKVVS